MIPKTCSRSRVSKKPWRSEAYLAWIREQPCLACGATWGNEAHHLRLGLRTMGVRKPDSRSVPLCAVHHARLHSSKEEWFWAAQGIDPIAWCEAKYAEWSAA